MVTENGVEGRRGEGCVRYASAAEFADAWVAAYDAARAWAPHGTYSVFTQWDAEHYLAQKAEFVHKYRVFFSVARALRPSSIIELGTYAGSGADAYLSGAAGAAYVGYDLFGIRTAQDDGGRHDPHAIAEALFAARGYSETQLVRADLRSLSHLDRTADLVVVDAAHDTYNEYEDLKLALSASPAYIWVDDSDAADEARPAIVEFLNHDALGRVRFTVGIDYIGGGLLIALTETR